MDCRVLLTVSCCREEQPSNAWAPTASIEAGRTSSVIAQSRKAQSPMLVIPLGRTVAVMEDAS